MNFVKLLHKPVTLIKLSVVKNTEEELKRLAKKKRQEGRGELTPRPTALDDLGPTCYLL